jgi:RHS repeat-associated protein
VVTSRDARGETIWTGYDELGRVTETRKDGATGALLTKRVYDTVAKGKPTSSTRYVGANAYTSAVTAYDDAYRPTAGSTTIPASEGALAGTYTTTMVYNAAGNVTQMKLPAVPGMTAETIETTYDDRLALPASVSSNVSTVGSVVNGVIRSPFGEGLIVGTGAPGKAVWFGYSFEEGTRRIIGSTVQRETQGGATDVSLTYGYDKGGNVTSITDSPSASGTAAETQCFRHDTQARLTEAWTPTNGCAAAPSLGSIGGPAGYWHSYGYDLAGNRRSETIHSGFGNIQRTYTSPAVTASGKGRPHSLSQVVTAPDFGAATTVAYGYDAAGNLTARNTTGTTTSSEAFNFDAEGRLASTTKDSATTSTHVYDADGDRLIKRENGRATLYLDGTEVELTTATGALVSTRYYQFDGKTVAMRQSAGGGLRLQFADHQGTAIWSVDRETTNDTRRRRFTPFGADRTGFTPVTWVGAKGFVNGDKDTATGLTHLGAREYDPSIGRFISVDPVMNAAEPQTLNGYAYARNNPVTLSDASGLYAVWDPVGGGYTCYGPCSSPAPWEDDYSPKQDHSVHNGGSAYSRAVTSGNEKEYQARRQVQAAEQTQAQVKRKLVKAAKQLGKILMDELGITAGLDCFTRGDLGACAETAVNVLLSSVGGFAAKVIGKYAFRWKAASRLVKTLWKLGGEIADSVKGYIKATSDLKAARRVADSLLSKSASGSGGRLPMTMECVCQIAGKYGIDISDVKVKIDKSRAGYFGSTSSKGEVTLTRDAFRNEEQLARTLAHERFHVDQIRSGMGYPTTYDAGNAWESAAQSFEDDWWATTGSGLR